MDLIALRDRCRQGPPGAGLVACADFDAYPLLSQLLAGKLAADGITWELPPHKLLLWLDVDSVRVCITAGDDHPKLWTTLSGLALGIDGVEQQLAEGHCEWKKPAPSKNGFTRHSR